MSVINEFSNDVLREFAHFSLGELRGCGMSRHVFDHPTNPGKVIKVELGGGCFQNVKEWEFWKDAQYEKDVAKWLAPCYGISYSGTFLIMAKAHDLRPHEIPEKLPAFLTDHKIENFGMLGKQVVCRDYGHVITRSSVAMRKWWGD